MYIWEVFVSEYDHTRERTKTKSWELNSIPKLTHRFEQDSRFDKVENFLWIKRGSELVEGVSLLVSMTVLQFLSLKRVEHCT